MKELDLLEEKVLDYIKSDSKIEEPTECGEDVPRINSPESGTEGGCEDEPEKEAADLC